MFTEKYMLIMYHYARQGNTILKDGLLGIKKSGRSLRPYAHRAGTDDSDRIYEWLDSTFEGRSNSISCLTEKIVVHLLKNIRFYVDLYMLNPLNVFIKGIFSL